MECATKDLHSGVFGGTVSEGMADLIWMMNQLVDENGKILVEGLMDSVAPLTKEEEAKYTDIDFDVEEYRKDLGAPGQLMHGNSSNKQGSSTDNDFLIICLKVLTRSRL